MKRKPGRPAKNKLKRAGKYGHLHILGVKARVTADWKPRSRKAPDDDLIADAIRLSLKIGSLQAAKQLGLDPIDVQNWFSWSKPTKTGVLSLPNLLILVRRAKELWQLNMRHHPRYSLMKAVGELGFSKFQINSRYALAGLPAVPGYPLYDDPAMQARCEAMARGERLGGHRAYDPPAVVRPPPVEPAPNGRAGGPPSSLPDAAMDQYLAARTRLQQTGHLRKG